jgi:hypothetical protein
MIDLILLVINAILILFFFKGKWLWPQVIAFILSIVGVLASLGATISVMAVGSIWNNINGLPNYFFTLHSSVFVGDISNVQNLFRI